MSFCSQVYALGICSGTATKRPGGESPASALAQRSETRQRPTNTSRLGSVLIRNRWDRNLSLTALGEQGAATRGPRCPSPQTGTAQGAQGTSWGKNGLRELLPLPVGAPGTGTALGWDPRRQQVRGAGIISCVTPGQLPRGPAPQRTPASLEPLWIAPALASQGASSDLSLQNLPGYRWL